MKTKQTVDRMFADLERLADTWGGERLLLECVHHATVGERHHRASQSGRGFRESVTTAARYFALQWTCSEFQPRKCRSYLDAATLRTDALHGYALRESLELPAAGEKKAEKRAAVAALRKAWAEAGLDYSEHIVGLL